MKKPSVAVLSLILFSVVLALALSLKLSHFEKLGWGLVDPAEAGIETYSAVTASEMAWFDVLDSKGVRVPTHQLWSDQPRWRLVVFWASWCYPCWDELEALKTSRAVLSELNIDLVPIGVSMNDEQWNLGRKLWQEKAMPFQLVRDLNSYYIDALNIDQLPASVLVDENNRVLAKFTQSLPLEKTELQDSLENLFSHLKIY